MMEARVAGTPVDEDGNTLLHHLARSFPSRLTPSDASSDSMTEYSNIIRSCRNAGIDFLTKNAVGENALDWAMSDNTAPHGSRLETLAEKTQFLNFEERKTAQALLRPGYTPAF
jgi:ankyrin repeat protein